VILSVAFGAGAASGLGVAMFVLGLGIASGLSELEIYRFHPTDNRCSFLAVGGSGVTRMIPALQIGVLMPPRVARVESPIAA
jgi:hypothetical protein